MRVVNDGAEQLIVVSHKKRRFRSEGQGVSGRFCRAGFTLTEIAIVLGIAGIVIAAIWTYASSARESYRVTTAIQQMMKSVLNIRDAFVGARDWQSVPGFWGAFDNGIEITQQLDARNLLPVDMRRNPAAPGATPLDHALNSTSGTLYNGDGSFQVDSGPHANQFGIFFFGLTQSACIKTLMQLPINDTALGIDSATIHWCGQTGPTSCSNPTCPQMTLATATRWCDCTPSVPLSLLVIFKFRN
jgi:prepilin-type N-terminal cleavage/methylation domain-containing protein